MEREYYYYDADVAGSPFPMGTDRETAKRTHKLNAQQDYAAAKAHWREARASYAAHKAAKRAAKNTTTTTTTTDYLPDGSSYTSYTGPGTYTSAAGAHISSSHAPPLPPKGPVTSSYDPALVPPPPAYVSHTSHTPHTPYPHTVRVEDPGVTYTTSSYTTTTGTASRPSKIGGVLNPLKNAAVSLAEATREGIHSLFPPEHVGGGYIAERQGPTIMKGTSSARGDVIAAHPLRAEALVPPSSHHTTTALYPEEHVHVVSSTYSPASDHRVPYHNVPPYPTEPYSSAAAAKAQAQAQAQGPTVLREE